MKNLKNRKRIGGEPRGRELPPTTVAKARLQFREEGRLDAMDVYYGQEPTRELFIHTTKGGKRKPMTSKQIEATYGKGYTPEVIDAAQQGYREGFERQMAEEASA